MDEGIVKGLFERHPPLLPLYPALEAAFHLTVERVKAGGKILTCGNGGSAADSEHIVGELMKGFLEKRPLTQSQKREIYAAGLCGDPEKFCQGLQRGIPAISLCSQTALLTAYSNDVDPAMVFAQQVFAYGGKNDVLIALSTSGDAENVVNAGIAAKAKGMKVIGFTGSQGGRLARLSDVALRAPARETYLVQEYHLPLYHALCGMLEKELFSESYQN